MTIPNRDDRSDAAALERALRAEGFDARVDGEGRLAVIVPATREDASAALRARAWPLARAAGFTHAALELVADEPVDHAAVHRD